MKAHEDPAGSSAVTTKSGRIGRRLPNLVVDGHTESEIFALAPAFDADRVHWQFLDDELDQPALVSLAQSYLPMAWVRHWSDAQPRIWVPVGEGDGARTAIRQCFEDLGVGLHNLRIERRVTFRDLSTIPHDLLTNLIREAAEWVWPRIGHIRQRLANELQIDDEETQALLYFFVHDLVDRYDDRRSGANGALNFLTFVMGKVRGWPLDVARTAHGRNVVNDQVEFHRLREHFTAEFGREPNEVERARALNVPVADLRRREQTVRALAQSRWLDELSAVDDEGASVEHHAMAVDAEAMRRQRDAALTASLLAAVDVDKSRSTDTLGLAAVYLSFWEGRGRTDIAEDLQVSPKVVTSAMDRLLRRMAEDGAP